MVSPSLVVLLVIIGAVFVTMMGYGTHRLIVGFEDPIEPTRSDEQDLYMRQVRMRHVEDLEGYGLRRKDEI
jgi:hypothetical protein